MEIEDYLRQSGFPLREEPAGNVETDPDPKERSFRLLVTLGVLGLSASRYNYGEFPDAMRTTPLIPPIRAVSPGPCDVSGHGFMTSVRPLDQADGRYFSVSDIEL